MSDMELIRENQMGSQENITAGVAVNPAPSIFSYDDYRQYLRDFYAYEKKRNPTFSFRVFSRRAGYSSSSVLKMIMEGGRNLTTEGIPRFCRALRLQPLEGRYFRNLVRFSQSQDVAEKQKFARAMLASKIAGNLQPLTLAKFHYWSHWYNIVIREMVGLAGFRNDPAWLANVLTPRITAEQAAESLANLKVLGLIGQDENGKLIQTQVGITSGDAVTHAALSQFHRDMIDRAKEAIDRFAKKERMISGFTLALSEANAESVRALIQEFRQDLMALAGSETAAERVFQLNLQFFPVTERVAK